MNMKKAEVSFYLKIDTNAASSLIKRNELLSTPIIDCQKDFFYSTANYAIFLEQNTLYNNMHLQHSSSQGTYGTILNLFDNYIPFHKKVHIALKLENTSGKDLNKFYLKENGSALETQRNGNWLFAHAKYAGTYSIAYDNVNPYIKTISSGYKGYFKFTISDGQSGIESYRATVNNQFVPMTYDGKYHSLYTKIDKEIFGTGKHTFELTVTDRVGNIKTVSYNFYL